MNEKSESFKRTRRAKMCYGLADIYGGGAFVIISTFFTVFLTKALGMPTELAGSIPLIGKIWDAVTDPVMGNITDRTVSKYGPKRFYLLVGSIISCITFFLMWVPFTTESMVSKYAFYVAMYMLFSTGFTIVMVPYNGLLPDMVEDYTERAKFSAVRTMLSTFGAILAGLIPSIIIKHNTNTAEYMLVAIIFSVIFFLAILGTFFGTWEKKKEPVKMGLGDSFRQSFSVYRSRSFRIFIAIFLCGQGAADFVTGLAIYYVDDVLNAYGGGRFVMLMGVILLSQFVGTIMFGPIMSKTSKRTPILVGFPVRIVATLALLFFSYEGAPFSVILGLSFVIGMGMAGSTVSIYAILSDMADVDELITTINRPGVCSGMATFIRKICTGLSSFIIGILLNMVGYDEVLAKHKMRQSAFTQSGIAYIYIFAPIVLMVLTILFASFFPFNGKEFEVIKKDIRRRKGEEASEVTEEEKAVIEKATGLKYEKLWNKDNAVSRR